MKLGLGSYTFRWSVGHGDLVPDDPMTALEILDVARTRGLNVVQYADNLPLASVPRNERRELAARAREWGIALELGTQSFDAAQVAEYIGIACEIDAHLLRIALDAEDAQTPIPALASEFRALLPEAKAAGVKIAIENHFKYPSRRMVDLLDTVGDDTLGVCLDVANSICAGEWPMETVAVLAPYTINLHLKDYLIVPDPYGVGFIVTGCPLGAGRIDIDAVLAALQNAPRNMSVILEHWMPRPEDPLTIRAAEKAWLDRHVAAARAHLPAD